MARFLASQLGDEHEPQGQAQSDAKVRLDNGERDESDEPGDEHQEGVVKNVVSNEQEEERAEGGNRASEQAGHAEMLGANPKTMNPHDYEEGSR